MTAERQATLLPDQVLQRFIDGNKRFTSGKKTKETTVHKSVSWQPDSFQKQ